MSLPGERVDAELLDRPVVGSHLYEAADDGGPATLRDQLDASRPTLLVFLRHLGCAFAGEMVRDVRVAAEERGRTDVGGTGERCFPRAIFVHTAGPRRGARFFGRHWPAAAAVSDPGRHLYDAAGFPRGSLGRLLGPRTWPARLRLAGSTLPLNGVVGDWRTLPGVLLLAPDGRALDRHDFRRVGGRVAFARFEFGRRELQPRYNPCAAT